MSDEVIQVEVKGDSSGLVAAFNKASEATGHLHSAFSTTIGFIKNQGRSELMSVAKHAAGIGAALAGAGVRAKQGLSAFGDLQTAMANVGTVADESKMSVGQLTDGVRKLATSGRVTQTVDQLAEGLYNIVSSGYQGGQALKVLQVAAQGATAGLTDAVTSGTAITQILNAYGMSAAQAADVSDILFQSVNVGVFSFGQLADTVGNWASVAASLKVPVGEATAALSAMTAVGSSADEAATQLRQIMLAFVSPSDAMAASVKQLGFESGEALVQQKGLGGAIKAVVGTTDGSATSVQNLFNEVRALNGVMQLTGTGGAAKFADFTKLLTDRTQYAGSTMKALDKQMNTSGAAGAKLRNEWREMSIELGQLVAPAAKFSVGGLGTILHALNSMPEPIRKVVSGLQLLAPAAAIVGGVLAANALKAWAFGKAASQIANVIKGSSILAKMPGAMAGADFLENWNGKFPNFIKMIRQAITSTDGFKAALARVGSQGFIMAAGMTAMVVGITQGIRAFMDAKSKAKEFVDTIMNVDAGNPTYGGLDTKIKNLTAAATEFDSRFGHRNIASKLLQGLGAAAQFANPFDRNTIAQDYEKGKAAQDAILALKQQKSAIADVGKAGEDLNTTFGYVNKAIAAGTLDMDDLSKASVKYLDAVAEAGKQAVIDPSGKSADSVKAYKNLIDAQAEMDKYRNAVDEVRQAENALVTANQALIDKTHAMNITQLTLAQAFETVADKANTAKDRMDAYGSILSVTIGKNDNFRNAQAKLGDTLRNVGDTLFTYGAAFDPLTEKGSIVQSALSGATEAAKNLASATLAQTDSYDAANNAVAQYIVGLISMAQSAGLGTDEIAQMITIMGLTPDQIATLVSLPGVDQSLASLLAVNYGLDQINGKVVTAGVAIQVSIEDSGGSADVMARRAENQQNAAAQVASIKDQINGLLDGFKPKNIAPKAGGGGGGGGASKWHPTAAQMAQAAKTIALPIVNQLTGALYDASINVWRDSIEHGAMMDLLTRGVMRVGAGEILAAAKSGEDPTSKLESAAENWSRLTKLVGSATADMVVDMYDSADAFAAAVDEIAKQIDRQRAKEDYLHDKGTIDNAAYRQLLVDRLKYLEEYSQEWISIMRQIDDLDKQQADDAKQKAQAHEDAAKTIKDAYKDLYDSIANPIKDATSLINAFGGQLEVSTDSIRGFFEHMKEGTAKWTDAIKQLGNSGLDKSFLMDLIKQGPKSLGLAQALLSMGPGGIDFVNGALGDINKMTGSFATGIAGGQVGAPVSNVNSNNITVQFGDTTITIDGTGVTVSDVQGMLAQAFEQLSNAVVTKVRK